MLNSVDLAEMLVRVPVILLALTLHELAHAWSADRLGDPTARYQGRITLNPLRHLDPLGTICLLFAPIGWAKPVPVNPLNFRNPGRDDIIVSAAGPVSNFAQAIVFALLLRLPWWEWIYRAGPDLPDLPVMQMALQAHGLQQALLFAYQAIFIGVIINVGLGVFNLLPFFPLDGHHIARENLHGQARQTFIEMQRFGPMIILGLVMVDHFTGVPVISWPIVQLSGLVLQVFAGY